MNSEEKTIYVVSGLPRSGTSMMMKMFEAGGIPALTDNARTADEDNPKGYYEFERVKKLPEDTEWMPDAVGHVVKMVFTLLHDLPQEGYTYKVVFMRRKLVEILQSQRTMLERQGKSVDATDEEIAESFTILLNKTLKWLLGQPNFDVQFVWYNEMIDNASAEIAKLNTFAGGILDTEAMQAVVDESLYRNRAEGNDSDD